MKIILAPDSFKGSLTALEVAKTMEKAILEINNNHKVVMKPMADGGEGTMEAMLVSGKGRKVPVRCTGPLGEKIETSYAILDSSKAVIEMAMTSGLVQVPENMRNPDFTTTYGLGEVIRDALDKGCTSILIGIGGSATNDGGLGMLLALGMKAWNEKGVLVEGFGKDLREVSKVTFKDLDPRLQKVELKVACDVDNPLCGSTGASKVFGPQKGATEEQIQQFDKSLENYGSLIEKEINRPLKDVPGSGAAGGVGFALLAIGADILSGAELLAKVIGLEEVMEGADLVITGEGQSDVQTLYGKAPGYVASLANKYGVPTVLLSGALIGNFDVLRERFSGCFSIVNKPLSLKESMEQAKPLLHEQTKQIVHFVSSFCL
ncbi:glycerate kinase [Oceanobacillus sp. Castelsardo]|uniref:glycerate kinase n=1 Tax=Oceanobacillus sp. Castelsardo TaxID=1851204 RepID=UPI000838E7A3|nr:glycerate kinase [Oceanobacillus sp. Castelsardo]